MNFLGIINVLKVLASLLPIAAQVVQAVEAALPNTSGSQKLEVVRVALEKAYSVEQNAETSFSSVWPVLSATIGGLVAAYNASGLFKKSTPAPAVSSTV